MACWHTENARGSKRVQRVQVKGYQNSACTCVCVWAWGGVVWCRVAWCGARGVVWCVVVCSGVWGGVGWGVMMCALMRACVCIHD